MCYAMRISDLEGHAVPSTDSERALIHSCSCSIKAVGGTAHKEPTSRLQIWEELHKFTGFASAFV